MIQRRLSDPLPLGDDELPYSKGLMARALIAAGVSADRAYDLARALEIDLAERGSRSVELDRFDDLARAVLGEEEGERAATQLRRLRDLNSLDVPLVILIGGATGTGKSTVATELAHRLGITRVTSTDFIRQTMRAFFSREFMPAVHYSSFEAGAAVPGEATGDPVINGFLEQCRHVCVGVEAAIRRSLTEGWSMVLEGVHLVPGLVPAELDGALLLHVLVAIDDEGAHRAHFMIRDATTGGVRPMNHYLDGIDRIRRVQSYVLSRSRHEQVPVIENTNVERTIGEVIELVLQLAAREHEPA